MLVNWNQSDIRGDAAKNESLLYVRKAYGGNLRPSHAGLRRYGELRARSGALGPAHLGGRSAWRTFRNGVDICLLGSQRYPQGAGGNRLLFSSFFSSSSASRCAEVTGNVP